VRRSMRRTGIVIASVVLTGLVACETEQPRQDAPGALPRGRLGRADRLSASTYVAHAELLERRGELERAAAQYHQALELAPDMLTARNRLGVVLNKLGRHGEASAEFRHALVKHGDQAQLYNNLGFSLYLEKSYEDAEAALARAVELQPTFRRARMNHALVLARLGRYDEGLAEFCEAGSKSDAYYNIAVLQAEDGHYVAAASALEQALQIDPGLDVAREQLRQVSRLAAAEEAAAQAKADAEAVRVVREQAEAARMAAVISDPEPAAHEEESPTPAPVVETMAVAAGNVLDEGAADFVAVADVQMIETVASASPAAATPSALADASRWDSGTVLDSARVATVYGQIEGLLNATGASDCMPPLTPALETMEPGELRELGEELLRAVALNAPWTEGCLAYLEELLGLPWATMQPVEGAVGAR